MSKVEDSSLDDGSIAFNKFHFVLLGEITNLEANIMIGVLGISQFVSDLQTLLRKDGSELKKRTIQIIDTFNYAIDVTLWGDLSVMEDYDYRYLLKVQITDHTGNLWATLFDDAGKDLIGATAKETYGQVQDNPLCIRLLKKKITFHQYLFTLHVRMDTFNNPPKLKTNVTRVKKVDYSSELKFFTGLLTDI
ncbi:hypothetical protein KI387_019054 [Taxus chinensis]|uniref:Uncharacterized protein n=1 Tax=Taxus chinensis TaxID=29808 RepID=A0AA38LD83_TAXCH|nr:hypothetical protein KI387_019054 [Taxus chinensis]